MSILSWSFIGDRDRPTTAALASHRRRPTTAETLRPN
jgi:hypothetical protein